MTNKRKQEIIAELTTIYGAFEPTEEQPHLDMFTLISIYNQTGHNAELIGGDWVVDNCPEPLCNLE